MADTSLESRQHLFSEAIYRINSELENVRGLMASKKPALLHVLKGLSFAPAYFDRRLRGYRYITIKNENWRWNDALRNECSSVLFEMFADDWDRNQVVLAKDWPERVRRTESGTYVFAEASHWQRIAHGTDFDEEAHRALLALVSGRLFRPGRNIEGLCHRCDAEAQAMDARLKFVISEFVGDESPRDARRVWYRFRDGTPSPARTYSQREGVYIDEDIPQARDLNAPTFYHALQNAVMRYDESSQLSHMLSVPIYDGGDMADPWGRIAGIIHLNLYTTPDSRPSNEELVELGSLFLEEGDKLPDVIRAVAQAQVVGWPVAGSRSAGGLAAGHFLELQPLFQEWDEVNVHDRDGALIERWGYDVSDGRAEWTLLDGEPQPRDAEDCELVVELANPGELLRLQWADPRDIRELSALTFRFRVPASTRLPDSEVMRDAVLRQYRQELIDTLRVVLPKVQRHRYSVRTAAIAIMGRNLSHNIGSHVLSSVASADVRDNEGIDLIGAKNDLLRYLQERMDFIAELSTTKQYMYLPMPLGDARSRLNAETLLRKYITGVENIAGKPAWLELVFPNGREATVASTLISVPSALIGLHAIYVIIENIARNSAKHRNAPIADKVKLTLDTQPIDGKFVKISIWDDAGEATPDLIERINSCIDDGKVVDDTGGIGEGNWGIREMCAAAAYLRGADIADIDGVGSAPPLLRAFVSSVGSGQPGSLGYYFYATVPEILVGVDNGGDRRSALPGVDWWPEQDPRWSDRLPHAYALICGSIAAETDRKGTAHRLPVRRLLDVEGGQSAADEDPWEMASKRWLQRMLERHSRHADASLPILRTPEARRGLGVSVQEAAVDGNCILFDHHIKSDLVSHADAEAALFYEYYDGSYDQSSLIDKAPAAGKSALENELRAAALARIAIIDERMQEMAASSTSLDGRIRSRARSLERRRIDVPSADEVGPLRSKPDADRIAAYLAGLHGRDSIDFLLVHQGILDRIGGSGSGIEWVCQIAKAVLDDAEVVVCSGRGAPSQAVGRVRFAPLSAVMRWTMLKPSKYHLHDLLCASRSPSHV